MNCEIFEPKIRDEVYFNTKQKTYPDGSAKITICSKAIFRKPGYEAVQKRHGYAMPLLFADEFEEISDDELDDSGREVFEAWLSAPLGELPGTESRALGGDRADNTKRAIEKIFDIAMLNEWSHFVTWTLDKDKIDRYDPGAVANKVKQKLGDMVKRENTRYLLIPEHHKDGAIHMHGLFAGDYKLKHSRTWNVPGQKKPVAARRLQQLGLSKDSPGVLPVYNMPGWPWGFSTAIPTYGERMHTAIYMTKYITKDVKKIFGNFYYAGGKLDREAPVTVYDVPFDSVDGKVVEVPKAQLVFKYVQTAPCRDY